MVTEMELRIMKGKKCRAMPDADDACIGEFLMQQRIERVLACLVEGGCRLVEEDPVGADEQDACKGKPLLFTK